MMPKPLFFATPAELRAWLDAHHQTEPELLLGFYGKGTGRPSVTWPQAVDEAIRVGWIDGQVRRIDETSHTRRFTPRRAGSIWSTVNVEKAKRLIAAGEMRPAGLRAFERRVDDRSGVYSYEQATSPSWATPTRRRSGAMPTRGRSSRLSRRGTGAPRRGG